MTELKEWETFYLIIGTASGALIGLQFVVLTLIAQRPSRNAADANAAFSSPTIVHFGTVLLLSALLQSPWQTITPASILWGLIGLSGIVYAFIVAHRMRKQKVYQPIFHDWMFHFILPLTVYITLVLSSIAAFGYEHGALFGTGGAILLLLFIGIHNVWDTVTYIVFVDRKE